MAAPARGRRRWIVLALLLGLLGLAAWWIDRQLEPQRLTATVLRQAGERLGLQLAITGAPEYALRPEPRLRLPNLVVRRPGDATPLLTVARAEVSLPWATLLDSDAALVISRIELDQPVLDLPALRRWQATQPEQPFELPTLTRGLRIVGGRVHDQAWAVDALDLDLPSLAEAAPARVDARGRYLAGEDAVDFQARVEMAKAAVASPVALRASGTWTRGERRLPVALALDGAYDRADGGHALQAGKLEFDSESPLPDFAGRGELHYGVTLRLDLQGQLARWPEGWPALPAPVSSSIAPLQLELGYTGDGDFSGPLTLALVRDDTRLQARMALPALQAWVDDPGGSPLPPLSGTLTTPELEIDGATLEGVRIEIADDPPAAQPP